jgi:DNA-binding XRE family transcriptional regulator
VSIARREEQDLARQHPLRLQILALAQRPGQSLDPRELFAKNLRHLRGVRRMTQEEVARLTEMHRTEISLLERGQREPRLGTLIKLSAVLEFPMRDFLEGIEWAPEQPEEASAGSFVAVPVEGDSAPA